ncbi:hypothetical protein PWG71_19325 [Nocardiopsis sp. N85]|uniref:hypothetical protein n=1 Tax=Nocardiopsis sp. N85 TaxID=3029400 RepID=UPI00237F8F46|nr:hypothetical protein [Nocardiopsis sp. N85]MDE3723547.1 hypothetical protein [Nocardiopsis sp. N85]
MDIETVDGASQAAPVNDAGRDTGTWDTGPVGNDTAAGFCGGLDDAATEEGAGMLF